MALSEPLNVRLMAVEYGVPGVNLYRFASKDGSALPSFEAGAHIDVELAADVVRQYSLLWPQPSESEYLIAVQMSEAGRGGSRKLHYESVVGDDYTISVPRNNFALSANEDSCYLIAGGIGITPIISMYRQRKAQGKHVELFYWAPRKDQVLFHDELILDSESAHVFITREDTVFPSLQDVINDIPESGSLYCCGPSRMMDEFGTLVSSRSPERVHVERFSASEEALQPGDGFRVTLKKSGLVLDVPPELTLLEICEENGVEVDYSCEEGICGACQVKVLEGQIEHRDSVLSEADRERGDCMMICCSRGVGNTLVLDL